MTRPEARGRRSGPPARSEAEAAPDLSGGEPGADLPRPWWRRVELPLLLLLAPLLVYAVSFQRPAHDTWTSLASGRHVARHGPTLADPFSFASRPADASGARGAILPSGWVNPNWGGHLALYLVQRGGGDAGLVVFKLLLYGAVAALLVLAARIAGAGLAAAAVSVAAALVLARPFLEIRAQDFGTLCLAALLALLAGAERRPRRAWWLPLLTALWANLHGSWVLAPASAAIAAAACAAVARRGGGWRHWAGSAVASLAAAAVVTPYRLANLLQPVRLTLSKEAEVWRLVGEWQSPFAAATPIAFRVALGAAAAVLVAAAAVALLGRRRTPERAPLPLPWSLIGLLALAVALAAGSRRFIVVAVLVAAPVAAALAGSLSRLRPAGLRSVGGRRALTVASWAVLVVVLLWTGLAVHRVYLSPWPRSRLHDGVLDRLTLAERELHGPCSFLASNRVHGRALNLWEDGGFLAWCQSPEPDGRLPVQLLIDGRAQAAYDAQAVEHYLELLEGPAGDGRLPPGWLPARLDALGIGLAVLPDTADGRRLERALAAEPGWRPAYEDGRGRILVDLGREEGRSLHGAVLDGSAHFPDTASRLASEAALELAEGGPGSPATAFRAAVGSFAAAPTSRALFLAARAAALDPSLDGALEEVLRDHLAGVAADRAADLPSLEAAVYAVQLLVQSQARSGDGAGARTLEVTLAGLQRRLESRHRATTW